MIRFESDYAEGAHEAILRRLLETNLEQTPGYGTDSHCENARKWIREACGLAQADVQFLVGGTQTNSAVIASVLRPHEAVLAADTGHIACHETGAVEASGHKVLTIPGRMGKMEAARAEEYLAAYWADETHEHMPKPAMLYLSQPTECGTLYSLAELRALRDVADAYHLCVYVDGARLGYGLASEQGDVTLEALSSLADVFTIGGTKVGALFGEAVVFANPCYGAEFRYLMKQRGAMLAKGRILGIQFETLFEDGLYVRIARGAVQRAMRAQDAFLKKGVPLICPSPTNQIFPILRADQKAHFEREGIAFSLWERRDNDENVYRLCFSWAVTDTQLEALLSAIGGMPV